MNTKYNFEIEARKWQLPLGVGAILLLLSAVLAVMNVFAAKDFWTSYLIGYTFTLAITLGCLFFVMFNNVAKASWHIVVRRIPETVTWAFPVLFVLGLPILFFGMHDLYHWTHSEALAHDEVLQGKQSYLNWTFFVVRYVFYFFIWTWLGYRLYTLSTAEDQDPSKASDYAGPLTKLALKLHMAGTGAEKQIDFFLLRRVTSAWGIPITALTTAFASFDLLMSLEPHWFSTMFGVYYFAGGFVSANSLILLIALYFRNKGKLEDTISDEHYHDLGKYMFAFTVFWAYIAFSQFMLIWYANLPEETIFFRVRAENGWYGVSMFLLFAHFIIPFFLLIGRAIKRRKQLLGIMAIWIIFMEFVDMYWLVAPSIYKTYVPWGVLPLNLMVLFGFVGLFVGLFLWKTQQKSLVPYNDVYFKKSLSFENI